MSVGNYKMKKVLSIILATSLLGLAACSSIFSKSDYPVSINSSPDGATFSITNRAGQKVHSGTTPNTITLNSSAGFFKGETYTVILNKPGFTSKTYTINSSVDGWYFGNILLGGVIGMLIVDPATGAMFNLPEHVQVSLDAQSTSITPNQLILGSIESLNDEQRAKLIRIN